MSTELNLDQMTVNQAGKEATVNAATGQIDAAITGYYAADLSAGNLTLAGNVTQRNQTISADGATVAGRSITLSGTNKRVLFVKSGATTTQAVDIKRGTTTYSLPDNGAAMIVLDGTTNGLFAFALQTGGGVSDFTDLTDVPGTYAGAGDKLVAVNSGETALEFIDNFGLNPPFDVASFFPAVPTATQVILYFIAPRDCSFPAGSANSYAKSLVAATASTVLTIKVNGTTAGTITFGIAGTTGTFSVLVDIDLNPGDVLTITGPGTPDATLGGIGITLAGVRT